MDPIIFIVASVCVFGIMFLAFSTMLTRAYVKVPAYCALVRSGGMYRRPDAPPKVVMNGGAWVFGFLHEVSWVDLRTLMVEITCTEREALITSDLQRVDIKVLFYIKVAPTTEGIVDAARTFGKMVDADVVKPFVTPKLHSALRDTVAAFTLMSLHQEGEKFIQQVQMQLKSDLEDNGLMLESMNIVRLEAAQQSE